MSERRDELTTDDLAGRMPAESASEEQQRESTAQEPEERTDVATAMREQTRDENGSDADRASSMPLFPAEEGEQFRGRWSEIQAGFVDDPREMVERADHLVADLMQRLAAQFSEERGRLESQWDSDDDVSTEDLRVTLTRYRSFFERLLEA
jgi:hypothetical protein